MERFNAAAERTLYSASAGQLHNRCSLSVSGPSRPTAGAEPADAATVQARLRERVLRVQAYCEPAAERWRIIGISI